jgi:hypothetical protein
VPVALASPRQANLTPPDAGEVFALSRGVASAVAPAGGLTQTQRLLMASVFAAMTGHPATLDAPAMTPEELARALAHRTIEFRPPHEGRGRRAGAPEPGGISLTISDSPVHLRHTVSQMSRRVQMYQRLAARRALPPGWPTAAVSSGGSPGASVVTRP